MNYRSRVIGVAVVLLVALLLFVPSATLAADVTLQAQQPVVDANRTIRFVGTGFISGERVATWATTPEQAVIGGDFASAHGDGMVEFGFHMPSNAIGGRWAMTAYGLQSKTPAVAYFDVNGRTPDTTQPQASVSPPSGPPGTAFAFAALGFDKKEKVSYWFTAPDGQVFAAFAEQKRSDDHGRIDIRWIAPSNAPLGAWVITIQGIKSNVARAVPFEIR
jgi:hypothetical protein